MDSLDRAVSIVCFAVLVASFWCGLVPMTLYYVEWLFNIGGGRSRGR